MPYIHPVLGVSCMTTSEFWAAEAKSENKPVDEVMEDYYTSIEDDRKRVISELKADKVGALKMLVDYYTADEYDFLPVEVLEITEAGYNYGTRGNVTSITVVANCSDNQIRTLKYTESYTGGSYMEPPDFDCNCQVIEN